LTPPVAVGNELRTDGSLGGKKNLAHLSGRELMSVDSSWLSGETRADFTEGDDSRKWDQFETNQKLFNVKNTYDENIYTKRLDKSSLTAKQIRDAERVAAEIEGSSTSNIHLREERGQAIEKEWDEEDRFSGVMREQHSPSYSGKLVSGGGPLSRNNSAESDKWRRGQKTASSSSPVTSAKPNAIKGGPATNSPSLSNVKSVKIASRGGQSTSPPPIESPYDRQSSSSPSISPNDADEKRDQEENSNDEAKIEKDISSVSIDNTANEKNIDTDKGSLSTNASASSSDKNSSGDGAKKTGLNPNAKPFVFNPNAVEFSPSFSPPNLSSATAPPILPGHIPNQIQTQAFAPSAPPLLQPGFAPGMPLIYSGMR
jgi:PAB1-binding protein PBP1